MVACTECPANKYRAADDGDCVDCPSESPVRSLGELSCRSVNCPLGQTATAESGWTCQIQESEYPIFYTHETSSSACYYPINHVDRRNRGIVGSHKYYTTQEYANQLNCRFSIKPAQSGAWRWQIIFMDIESESSCRYDKLTRVGDLLPTNYWCNGRGTTGNWNNEYGEVFFTFTTDGSVTENGYKFVFEPIKQQAELTNARFASYDASRPHGEGNSVQCPPGQEASKGIDGDLGLGNDYDHTVHPLYPTAQFFVDLVQPAVLDYVTLWVRTYHVTNSVNWDGYYGIQLYAGSTSCTPIHAYTKAYIESNLAPNEDPMIFSCPPGTFASTLRLTPGSAAGHYLQFAEIEAFNTIHTKAVLGNARFAQYDNSQTNGEGVAVASYSGWEASKAIDGEYGWGESNDHAAHPENDGQLSYMAHFFVDFGQSEVVFVLVWPRTDHRDSNNNCYEGIELYVGSTLCSADRVYTQSVVENDLYRNEEPMIFRCDSGTTGSTIRLARGYNGPVQLAEIEVYTFVPLPYTPY